jgi:hypothetical protein
MDGAGVVSRIWTPRPDQRKVLAFGEERERWALFAPTGAGKTAIASTWVDAAMNDSCDVARTLIVAPPIPAAEGWPQQFGTWAHLGLLRQDHRVLVASDFDLEPGVLVVSDDDAWETQWSQLDEVTRTYATVRKQALTFRDRRTTKKRLQSYRERVHLVSWPFFPWLVKAYGKNFPYQCVVFDESSFLRDAMSERGTAARHCVQQLDVVSHLLLLTASPNDDHTPDVWPQINLIAPGLLGHTLAEFRERWCQPDSRNYQTGQVYTYKVVPALMPQLTALVAKHAVSVPSSLGVTLVPVEHRLALPEAARAAHSAMERDGVCRIGKQTVVAPNAGVTTAKLRQIASGFVYDNQTAGECERVLFLHNSKIEAIQEMAETEGSILVGYQWTEELRRLRAAFGKHVADIRDSGAKAAFEAGRLKILAVHPASAGHGVDGLQHATNQVWWASVPEAGELHGQLNGRVHRHGTSADTVYAHYFMSDRTRESQIFDEMLPRKAADAAAFLTGLRV